MKFSESLKQAGDSILKAQFEHPFVKGLGDGTLHLAKFRLYIIHYSLYIVDCARAMAWRPQPQPRLRIVSPSLRSKTWLANWISSRVLSAHSPNCPPARSHCTRPAAPCSCQATWLSVVKSVYRVISVQTNVLRSKKMFIKERMRVYYRG